MFLEAPVPNPLGDDADKNEKAEREERHRVLFEREMAKELSRGDDQQHKVEQLAVDLKEVAQRNAEEAKKRERPERSNE